MEREIDDKIYGSTLDEDLKKYIDEVNKRNIDQDLRDISQIRTSYAKVCSHFASEAPNLFSIKTVLTKVNTRSVQIRCYKKKNNSKCEILYVHGGGFIMGDLDSHDDICADLCDMTGFNVTAVNYRLAPENPYPAALDDIRAVYLSLQETVPTIVIGDSAGATLCAMLSSQFRGTKKCPAAQILIYPYLGGDMTQGSYITHSNVPGLSTKEMKFYIKSWMPRSEDMQKLPLRLKDFHGLPPTIIFTASEDPLYSDGLEYIEKLKSFGVKALHVPGNGLIHGFLRARHTVKKAKKAFLNIVESCQSIGREK